MSQVVLVVAFGEPPSPDRAAVIEYLENIFYQNADLEDAETESERRSRAGELAQRRAPGIIDEYEEIGGSPLNRQAEWRADELQAELRDRGYDVETVVGYQFMDPTIETRLAELRDAGCDRLVTLPLYPLCGPTTTVATLDRVDAVVDATEGWAVDAHSVSGWHRHPGYLRSRAAAITDLAAGQDIDFSDPGSSLVFSAHGTPTSYVEEGSRYVQYVNEYCDTVASMVGVDGFELGYQNHETRGIEWTQPSIESVIEHLDGDTVVVDPASFLHEQSETLSELDIELADEAADRGIEFHRVPVPHEDPRITGVCADVVEPFLADIDPRMVQLRRCRCHPGERTRCLNAPR